MRNRGSAKLTAIVVFAIVGIMVVSPIPTYIQNELSQVEADLVTILPGFLTTFTAAKDLGPLPASTPMTVGVAIAPPDPGAADAYVYALYSPGSPYYHHFLSSADYRAMFSPTPSAYSSVESYYSSYGLTLQPTPDRLMLGLEGASSSVGQAFHTSFDKYSLADGKIVYGSATPVSVPGNLPITGVTGMSNAVGPQPLQVSPAVLKANLDRTDLPAVNATPGAWSCTSGTEACNEPGYYGEYPLFDQGYTGTGVTVGIVDAYDSSTPQSSLASAETSWASGGGLPTPKENFLYPIPHTANLNTSASSGWGGETELDEEMVDMTAPGSTIDVAFATDSSFAVYEVVDYLVANNVSQTISMSWGEADVGTMYAPPQNPCMPYYSCNASWDGSYAFLHPVFAEAVAEGITPFAAAGDCGAADGTAGDSTDYPSSDPFVVGVGGTIPNGTGSTYAGETGWSGNGSKCTANTGGGGGGYAPFPQPWWQHGPGQLTHNLRGDPDVSTDSSDGTSQASPMWAGWMAVADQIHGSGLGLVGPSMYSILRNSTAYAADFHDIKTGNNGYKAGVGWDPITGIGTPICSALLPALAAYKPTYFGNLHASLSATPTRGSAPLAVWLNATVSGGTPPYHYDFVPGVNIGEWTSASTLHYSYAKAGVYDAMVTVFDSAGNSTTSQPILVNPGGTALTVTLSASATSVSLGQIVNFTGTASGGTSPYHYTYYYGDATYGYNATTTNSHAYRSLGTFCPSLFVSDASTNGGYANTTCITVTSPSSVPIISSFSANPAIMTLGNTTYLNISAYGGSGTLSYAYAGLPAGCTSSNTNSLSCLPTAAGTYTVRAYVNDSSLHSVSANTTLTVNMPGVPIAISGFDAFPGSLIIGGSTYLNVTASGGTGALSYYFTGLPSGCSTQDSPSLHCTPTATGSYDVRVFVNDSNGHTANADTTLSVTPVTVTLVSLSPTTAPLLSGGSQSFTAIATCDAACPAGIAYSWNLTNSAMGTITGTGASVSFTAGSTAGIVNLFVNATLNSVTRQSAPAVITITVPTLSSVSVSPTSVPLAPFGVQVFTASATCTATCPSGTVYAWSLTNNQMGKLSATSGQSVTFTAAQTAGTVGLIANGTLNGLTKTSPTAIIAVTLPAGWRELVGAAISPTAVSVSTMGTETFTVVPTCTGGDCPSMTTYSWTLNNTLGKLSSSTGTSTLFTAGNGSGLATLTVMVGLNGTFFNETAAITITPQSGTGGGSSFLSGTTMWILIIVVVVVAAAVVAVVLVRRKGKKSAAPPPGPWGQPGPGQGGLAPWQETPPPTFGPGPQGPPPQ
jgi:kumamolisin